MSGRLKPPLPGEDAQAYHRRVSLMQELPVVTHEAGHISESTKIAFTLGRTVAIIAAVFWAGWIANAKVTEVLTRQEAIDKKLIEVLTKKDLGEAEMRVERRLLDRFASRDLIASCPVFTVRGRTHKPCTILGLTEPREK